MIGDKIDLLFARMRPGRLVERANWSLLDEAALHQPTRPGVYGNAPADARPARAEDLVLRVERQTLREGAQIQVGKYRLVFVIGTLGASA